MDDPTWKGVTNWSLPIVAYGQEASDEFSGW